MPLTAQQVSKSKPGDKVITLSDGSGLELRISPNGRKGWRFRYVRPNGKRNMISFGTYPETTLAEAREKRIDARRLIAKGIDPAEERKREQNERQEIVRNKFITLAQEWHKTVITRWKEGSRRGRQCWSALERYVLPDMAERDIDSINPLEWLEVFKRIDEQEKFEQRRKVHAYCRDIYKFAVITGRATHNPLIDITSALQRPKKSSFPFISQEELPELIQAIELYDKSKMVQTGLKLLFMTAVRPSELREAKWAEFDFQKGIWTIPAERMKMNRKHRVPLPRQALKLLHELHYVTGSYGILFVGRNANSQFLSNAAFGMALKRMGYEGRHVPHGTRHTVATGLKEMGYPGEWIEMQLSHKLPGIQGVYTHAEHMAPEQRPAMMQAWADKLFPNE
ncbi:tyrosine-type recombinase/integrase [Larsenimonas rhizosphaerae]|uniref:tyrosine-type recombinase/integrase n=1 Tax=Larsenimonas rhizosphaerae TaxID=2944682 RepID=UPI00203356BB|nr:integrase arm-type DNA-binding domain-containing protein [Larsenimonas rhizosphaerae]MCM2131971.1 tyrosine-type recombinase/integrase [Larsenimonas rhizosphaerae]